MSKHVQPGGRGEETGAIGRSGGAGGGGGGSDGTGGESGGGGIGDGGADGGAGGDGGGEGQPALNVSPPVAHAAPDHHIHCCASCGQMTVVEAVVIEDHSVPADGPMSQRPPEPTAM